MKSPKVFLLKIYRGVPGAQYWEEFALTNTPFLNVISALMSIQQHPINRQGKKVPPVVWEQGCLEEVCGSCSMLINGSPRQACSAIIDPILQKTGSQVITLAPMTKFPLVRDLFVDRSAMFGHLQKIRAWVDHDGSFVRGKGERLSQKRQQTMQELSSCMTCGCCLEACPQVNRKSSFIGPAAISQARLFNLSPAGSRKKKTRLRILMEDGGISSCGNAQNCVQVCPKEIPLTESIAVVGREVSIQAMKEVFHIDDRE